jgi:hypothetical protein
MSLTGPKGAFRRLCQPRSHIRIDLSAAEMPEIRPVARVTAPGTSTIQYSCPWWLNGLHACIGDNRSYLRKPFAPLRHRHADVRQVQCASGCMWDCVPYVQLETPLIQALVLQGYSTVRCVPPQHHNRKALWNKSCLDPSASHISQRFTAGMIRHVHIETARANSVGIASPRISTYTLPPPQNRPQAYLIHHPKYETSWLTVLIDSRLLYALALPSSCSPSP